MSQADTTERRRVRFPYGSGPDVVPPALKCVVVCAWDSYHTVRVVQHGLVVCEECERPVKCIEHECHGAILATGEPVVIRDHANKPGGA